MKIYQKKAEGAEFFKTLSSNADYTQFEPKEFYADGDKVFCTRVYRATVKNFEHECLMEFTLKW